jgi:hypothetical protein
MKKKLKGLYLIISSIFISLLHLPVSFAKSAVVSGNRLLHPVMHDSLGNVTSAADGAHSWFSGNSVYDSLHLDLAGLSKQAYEMALAGLRNLKEHGQILNDSIISIIDFSQPSSKKRLYILDLKNYKILFNTLVAHGRNTGRDMAEFFSNRPSSHKSSLGFYVTGDTYNGGNGYSLKLEGIEKGINDNAERRAIVMHGADYVSQSYVDAQGFIGRSEGCPAIPEQFVVPVINTIKQGTCLFIYHPDSYYIHRSHILNG